MNKKRWFIIDNTGNIQYIGDFETIDDADMYVVDSGIEANWILSETTAKEWKERLTFYNV